MRTETDRSDLRTDRPKQMVAGALPTISDYKRRALLYLVISYLRIMGATGIRARLPSFHLTPLYEGEREDHRPDLLCQQWDQNETYLMVDVVTEADLELDSSRKRWELLCSAAERYGVEIVFVTSWNVGPRLRVKLRSMGLPYTDIWAIGGAA